MNTTINSIPERKILDVVARGISAPQDVLKKSGLDKKTMHNTVYRLKKKKVLADVPGEYRARKGVNLKALLKGNSGNSGVVQIPVFGGPQTAPEKPGAAFGHRSAIFKMQRGLNMMQEALAEINLLVLSPKEKAEYEQLKKFRDMVKGLK